MNNLWWKQWQENKRHLVVFMVWMILGACYAIAYQMGHKFRAPVGQFSSVASFSATFTAVFLAMRAARGEQADGTHSFSSALPVSLRRIATIRILGAAATLILPILAAAVLMSVALSSGLVEQAVPRVLGSYVSLPDRETATLAVALGQLWSVTAVAAFAGLELLLVCSVAGCWLRNQSQIGLMGAVIAFVALLASGLLWTAHRNPVAQLVYGACFPQSLVIHWGYGSERGDYVDHEIASYHWIALALAVPILVFIGRLFVSHYGLYRTERSSPAPGRPGLKTPSVWFRIPLHRFGRLTALIWSEFSQSLPLAICGLLVAFLMTLADVIMDGRSHHSLGASMLMDLPHSTWAVAMLWGVVVGSSLYSAELSPGLGSFWRSRPISPGKWFWSKFAIGLLAVLSVLDGVTILLSWASPKDSMTTGMSWAYVGCMPIQHSFLYALAVLGTCWLRKPVIGGFVALAGFVILTVAIGAFPATSPFEPINVYDKLLQAERARHMDFTRHGYPLVYGGLVLMILLIALFSYWLAKPLEPRSIKFGPPEES
jgi:ABC-type transport system involved in multi-copper enzyme maturation permease subunit